MQPSVRCLRRHFDTITRRYLGTAPEPNGNRYPSQIGGLHYQEGDRVIVINKDGKRVKSRLTAPLSSEGTTVTGQHAYAITHSDIIGKPARRLYVHGASTSKVKEKSTTFRVAHPSLEQFVSLSPRKVTPIYSSYGATIVTLLDIHVAPPLPSNDPQTSQVPPLQILEAGTGNGGLTLHLARAIAAANPPPPNLEDDCTETQLADSWEQWRSKRRAFIHTVEFEGSRSRAAEKLIKSFRGALYWPHIDFHSGDVGTWVSDELKRRSQQNSGASSFLDIVILDLPSVHRQIPKVVDALNEDGQLLVWVPQITQIASCQHEIEYLNLPLKLDQVVEFGEGISNGRRWDLRFVSPRAQQRKQEQEPNNEKNYSSSASDPVDTTDEEIVDTASAVEEEVARSGVEFPTMVCRPIVGNLIMGGGFVGLWRKVPTRNHKTELVDEEG